MPVPPFILKEVPPDVVTFASIRNTVGWSNPELDVLQNSIDSSLFWVSAYDKSELVGCGRVIGDGAMYFYIQDVLVHPLYQNRGLGSQIMHSINQYITLNGPIGATVGLLAAHGKEAFYQQYGFAPRDGQQLGLGMCKFV
ncbi:GNAT family N-acetyltransferase [Salinimonas sediminis]|uniref:N-acetyltransferase n=1 Tax=Salinimonas sediminis TaxID=2303538 RepID=A0A346NSA7_9ALTE|nr:GNAT family N-acetyltransferase [Salinimonas sediminis]AXR08414.1 N-acetyltransferase [Salinimonas sediminis]